MSEYSQSRIERKISEAINTMIVKGEIKNQKVGKFVSVSRLEVSSDNAYAKIFISSLFDDEEKLNNSVKAYILLPKILIIAQIIVHWLNK